MATVFSAEDLPFILRQSPLQEFSWHTSPELSRAVQSKQFKFSVRSLDPGKYSYPYHFHRNSEELFVILSGEVTLRTPAGFSKLSAGNIVFFEIGPNGAHQLYNHTDQPCQFLDLGAHTDLDVCEYPDSGKINILPNKEVYRTEDRVDYYQGEENVSQKWQDR